MRKKHRVIVEVTFDKRVTAKFAKEIVQYGLNTMDNLYFEPQKATVQKMTAKEAERVIQAELRNRWRVLTSRNSEDRLGQPDGESG